MTSRLTGTNCDTNEPGGRRRSSAWFSAGLAVALVAGGSITGLTAGAAGESPASSFVPIVPCRLMDTRPSEQVGTRGTPIGTAEAHLQQVTGSIGDCDIPVGATAVAMNVVAVGPTAASFLTIYPDGNALPLASNLNYVAGQAPTPNKVDVALSAQGKLRFYNNVGSVHVVADVVGYYESTDITELTKVVDGKADKTAVHTKAQVDSLIADVADAVDAIDVLLDMKPDTADVYDKDQVDTLLAGKASTADVAANTAALATKADAGTVYDKDQVDTLLAGKASTADVAANTAALATKADAGTVYDKDAAESLFMGRDPDLVMRQGTGEIRNAATGLPLPLIDPILGTVGLGVGLDPTLAAVTSLVGPAALHDTVFERTTEYQLGVVEVCVDDAGVTASVIDTIFVHWRDQDGTTGVSPNLLTSDLGAAEGCRSVDVGADGNHDVLSVELRADAAGDGVVITDIRTTWVPVPVTP